MLLFFSFSTKLNVDDFSNVVTIWSLGNILSMLLLMSSMTMAPQYFFKSTARQTQEELLLASYFQIIRLVILMIFSLILVVYVHYFHSEYMQYVLLVIYNMTMSILPIWREYSTRNLKHVLFIETVLRLPVIVYLSLQQIMHYNLEGVFMLFIFLIISGLLYTAYDIGKFVRMFNFSFKDVSFSLDYVRSIIQVNSINSIFVAGPVFMFSFVGSASAIVEAAMAERVKNIFLQIQGLFISERVSSNRDYITNNIFDLKTYLSLNRNTLLMVAAISIISVVLFSTGWVHVFFNIEGTNPVIGILILLALPISAISLIFVGHVYNSLGAVERYKKIYYAAGILLLIILSLSYVLSQPLVFISSAWILELTVIFISIFYLRKLFIRE